jgi:hypothetical protein
MNCFRFSLFLSCCLGLAATPRAQNRVVYHVGAGVTTAVATAAGDNRSFISVIGQAEENRTIVEARSYPGYCAAIGLAQRWFKGWGVEAQLGFVDQPVRIGRYTGMQVTSHFTVPGVDTLWKETGSIDARRRWVQLPLMVTYTLDDPRPFSVKFGCLFRRFAKNTIRQRFERIDFGTVDVSSFSYSFNAFDPPVTTRGDVPLEQPEFDFKYIAAFGWKPFRSPRLPLELELQISRLTGESFLRSQWSTLALSVRYRL